MMMIMIMMMMIMMIMMIMTIVSVEQRPGWGEHVQTHPTITLSCLISYIPLCIYRYIYYH